MAHKGRCFCGAVEIEVEGAPEAMGYCHCQSCRSWSAGPVNAFSLWKPDAVKVTKGRDQIATFAKTPMSERQYCKTCGGHIMTNHPPLGMIDVYSASIPTLEAERLSEGIRRLGRDHGGVAPAVISAESGSLAEEDGFAAASGRQLRICCRQQGASPFADPDCPPVKAPS
jgi:hypothetical protein